jgi:hypothetical protein
MPTMVPVKNGKAAKIREQLLGSPRNEHDVHTKDPRIRQADKQRVLQALLGQMPQQQMPNNDMGIMQ